MLNDLWAAGEPPWRVWERERPARRPGDEARRSSPAGAASSAPGSPRRCSSAGETRGLVRPPRPRRAPVDAWRCSGIEADVDRGRGRPRPTPSSSPGARRARGSTRSSTSPPRRSSAPSQARRSAASRPNVRGTWTLLEACRERGVERVVVASSDKAYGAHDELPYREDFALQPTAPYEASKAAADLIARSYWHSYGLPVAVTRFANIYGGGDLNFSRLVPEAVCAALDGPARRCCAPTARPSATSSTSRTRPRLPGDRRRARPRRRPRRGVQRRRRAPVLGSARWSR